MVSLTLTSFPAWGGGDFTQISYVRQRIGFTQTVDEAIRDLDGMSVVRYY